MTRVWKARGAVWETKSERKGGTLNHAGSVDYYDEFGFTLSELGYN